MENKIVVLNTQQIQNRIFTIRDKQVMIDSDIAELYNVSTGRLNEQVKRNIKRFPDDFMFRLTDNEWEILKSQNAISSWGGRRKLPNVFTEQGIASLSGILKSETAINVNISIMRAFVQMRNFISINAKLFQRIETLETKQVDMDSKLNEVLEAIETENIKPKQGIFFEGQIFDAYKFVSDLFRSAKTSILIIDNYVDDTVLTHLTKKKKTVKVSIYTKNLSEQLKLDAEKFNSQYKNLTLKKFNKSHDRFIIIDDKDIYHFGASLKDLGKKWFAFSKFGKEALTILEKLEK